MEIQSDHVVRVLSIDDDRAKSPVAPDDFEIRFKPLLADGFRVASSILRDSQEAEDVLQEAALHAWRSYARFRGDDRAARAWFLTIVTNGCRTRLRSSWWKRGRASGGNWSLEHLTVRSHDRSVELHADLETALAQLTWGQRATLCLYYQLDHSQEEVARILGCRVGTVKSRLNRAMRALRVALEEDY